MHSIRMAAGLLVVAVLAGACAEDSTPAGPDETAAVSFDWSNNADIANPRIHRGETGFAICWTDPGNNLRVCEATFPLGGGTEPDCGLQEVSDPIQFQDVGIYDPDDIFSSWIHEVAKGTGFITVRDLSQPGECFGSALVAEGWGAVSYVDNDIFGIGTGGNNANSYGFDGHGTLTAPDGSTLSYSGHIHWRDNDQGFKMTSAKVNVH